MVVNGHKNELPVTLTSIPMIKSQTRFGMKILPFVLNSKSHCIPFEPSLQEKYFDIRKDRFFCR